MDRMYAFSVSVSGKSAGNDKKSYKVTKRKEFRIDFGVYHLSSLIEHYLPAVQIWIRNRGI